MTSTYEEIVWLALYTVAFSFHEVSRVPFKVGTRTCDPNLEIIVLAVVLSTPRPRRLIGTPYHVM